MGLTYVNPAPKRGSKRRATKRVMRANSSPATRRRKKTKFPATAARLFGAPKPKKRWGSIGSRKKTSSRSRAASAAVEKNPKKKRKKMARKLYGAAAKSHARKHKRSRRRARRNPPQGVATPAGKKWRLRRRKGGVKTWQLGPAKRRKRRGASKKRRTGGSKRSRAAKKAAATRAARKARRSAAGRKAARSRKRRGGGRRKARRTSRKRSRSRKTRRAAPKRRRSRRARRMRGGRRSTSKSLARARRSIRNRRKTAGGRAYMRRYHMRSNPSFGGVLAMIKDVLPIAFSLYGSRFASSKLLTANIPGVSSIPAAYQGVAMAGGVWALAGVLTTKVAPLRKFRGAAMLGCGLNFVDQLIGAIAPANVKAMFGLSDYIAVGDIYSNGLSDYVTMGATPIDDDITLRDYIEVGALEEELGISEELGLEQEMGLEEELGAADGLSRAYLGGVAQSSMLKQIPSQPLLAPVPERSFTKDIRRAGQGYDNSDRLYGGIFAR